MENLVQIILLASLVTTLLMAALSFFVYHGQKVKGPRHLMQFWAALGLHGIAYWLLQDGPKAIALSMLGWPWVVWVMGQLLEDMTGLRIRGHWHLAAFALGGFLSLVLYGFNLPFMAYTLPFSLAVAVVGLSILFQVMGTATPLQRAFCAFSGPFFLSCLTFPFWRMGLPLGGFLADLLAMIGFAGTTLAASMEFSMKVFEEDVSGTIKARNEKLLGNSKYSELGMMAAGIAHEINNPLAVIQARTTQLLRFHRDPSRQQELSDGLEQILYTSERINRTIQGVREFVHDERIGASEVRLKALIDDVLSFCGQRMKNHGVSLRFYGIDGISVWGNKIQIEQIILNLLNNSFDAIEFLPDKWIELSAHQYDDRVQIYVKDSGQGIPAEIAEHIMEPFFSTKDVGKGTGLGLALAQGIAQKHGGNLKYMQESSHTTFMLDLPREPREDWGIPLVH